MKILVKAVCSTWQITVTIPLQTLKKKKCLVIRKPFLTPKDGLNLMWTKVSYKVLHSWGAFFIQHTHREKISHTKGRVRKQKKGYQGKWSGNCGLRAIPLGEKICLGSLTVWKSQLHQESRTIASTEIGFSWHSCKVLYKKEEGGITPCFLTQAAKYLRTADIIVLFASCKWRRAVSHGECGDSYYDHIFFKKQ